MSKSGPKLLRPAKPIYSIPLSDTPNRTWTELDGNHSQLIYSWPEIEATPKSSLTDINIAVTKRHRTAENAQIKEMASAIYEFSRISRNDGVFAMKDQRLERFGFVKERDTPEQDVVILDVEWVSEFELDALPKGIIKEGAEIQKLSSADLKAIEKAFPREIALAYDSYRALLQEQYDTTARFEAFEQIKGEPELQLPEAASYDPKEDDGGPITLFYGTSRNNLKIAGKVVNYGDELTELSVGVCQVSIPPGHQQGNIDRPWKIWKLERPEHKNLDMVLEWAHELSSADFAAYFANRQKEFGQKEALVFIHGYNTKFADAAYRSAQIAWDIPFDGFAGFFSWPSTGKIVPYDKDEARARASSGAFAEFIQMILEQQEVETLHIIAHSMGNQVLTLGLNKLGRDTTLKEKLAKIHQIILAAPDIDQSDFKVNILPEFSRLGRRRTIYASDRDFPLGASSWKRGDLPRLGQCGEYVYLDANIDTIDASNVKSLNSHSYAFDNKSLLTDLYFLLTLGLEPVKRRLRGIDKDGLRYWLFPK